VIYNDAFSVGVNIIWTGMTTFYGWRWKSQLGSLF